MSVGKQQQRQLQSLLSEPNHNVRPGVGGTTPGDSDRSAEWMTKDRGGASTRQSEAVRKTGEILTGHGFRPFALMPGTNLPGVFEDGAWRIDRSWEDHVAAPPSNQEIERWTRFPSVSLGVALGSLGADGSVATALLLHRLPENLRRTLAGNSLRFAILVGGGDKLVALCRIDGDTHNRLSQDRASSFATLCDWNQSSFMQVPLLGPRNNQSCEIDPTKDMVGQLRLISKPIGLGSDGQFDPSDRLRPLDEEYIDYYEDYFQQFGFAGNEADRPFIKPPKLIPSRLVLPDPSQLQPRPWLYSNLYSRGTVTVTIGPGGSGKSTLALAESVIIASGKPIYGETAQSGPSRVWYLNQEDPEAELMRRVAGFAKHYKITSDDIGGRLFMNSSISTPLKLSHLDQHAWVIDKDEVDRIKGVIHRSNIDLMIIDPFVAIHDFDENSNTLIDRVAKALASIAVDCNCAVGLVHHTRKGGQGEQNEESSRGASALIAAARCVRVFNTMTASQAEKFGLSPGDHKRHFQVSIEKQNLSATDNRPWFSIVSVNLGNGETCGVPERWFPPDISLTASADDIDRIKAAVGLGDYGESSQAKDWAGYAIGPLLGIDPSEKPGKARLGVLIKQLIADKHLRVSYESSASSKRAQRPMLRVGSSTAK